MINLENISFDHCIKCTVCTVYCPVARVTHLYPGPKQSGPDTERLRIKNPTLLDKSLKYCTNCKRCEIACPSDVKIADIIQSAKWKYTTKKFNLRDFLLSRTDLMGSMNTLMSPLVNFATSLPITKMFLDSILKIPGQREFPAYGLGQFISWLKRREDEQRAFTRKVLYYHGCYVNYNNHQLGKDLVKVLNAMDIGVLCTDEKCCGVPLIASGDVVKATKNAVYNLDSLGSFLKNEDMPIVATSSSCTLAITHEYKHLLELDNSHVADRFEFISMFLLKEFAKGNIPKMKPLNITVAYHAPCHLERMGIVAYTISLLKKIPGVDVKLLNAECCGISGTYGFKKENYEISQKIVKPLLDKVKAINPDEIVTDCETCKWQIDMNTKYDTLHPITLIARAMGD